MSSSVKKKDADEDHTNPYIVRPEIFRGKKRPGPSPAGSALPPERDLIDAVAILELIESGEIAIHHAEEEEKTKTKKRSKRLNASDEAKLAYMIQQWGDIDARNKLVMANIGLVHLVANQFCRPPLRYEDLVQEGTMGLIRATESFEPHRGVRFSTYSVYWIRAKIQRLLQRIDKDDVPAISGADFQTDREGRKRKPRARKISIEGNLETEDSRTLIDVLASDVKDPEDMAINHEKDEAIKSVLEKIVSELKDPRLKYVIENRLLTEEPQTLAQIGEKLHLSREGARLLESKLLKMAKIRLKDWKA